MVLDPDVSQQPALRHPAQRPGVRGPCAAHVEATSTAGRIAKARPSDDVVADLRDNHSKRGPQVDDLIEANLAVARSLASRYRDRGIDRDDLEQVAYEGLTKAARRFDQSAGYDFLAYAVPTIRGELLRPFRDCGWAVRPPRRVQEMQGSIMTSYGELTLQLGRSPRASDYAAHLDEALADVEEALAATGCFSPASLDTPAPQQRASTLGDLIAHRDRELKAAEARLVLEPLLRRLPARDLRIVHLRFYQERTQQEIADDMGLTQAQVSRIILRILRDLRGQLQDPAPHDHRDRPPAA